MLLGAAIAMFVVGLTLLVQGEVRLSKTRVARGVPARVVGLIAMAPWPFTEAVASVVQVAFNVSGSGEVQNRLKLAFALFQFGLIIVCAILAYWVAFRYSRPGMPRQSPPRSSADSGGDS